MKWFFEDEQIIFYKYNVWTWNDQSYNLEQISISGGIMFVNVNRNGKRKILPKARATNS